MDVSTMVGLLCVLLTGRPVTTGKILPEIFANKKILSCEYNAKVFELKCSGELGSSETKNRDIKSTDFNRAERIIVENCQENFVAPPIHYFDEMWQNLTAQFDHLSEIQILNCRLFDGLKLSIFNRSLPTLKIFTYAEDCNEKICPKFCDRSLNGDFMQNIARAAPNLESLSLVNVGLCPDVEVANFSGSFHFYGFRSLKVLDLSFNSLVEFPHTPSSLLKLNVSNNELIDVQLRPNSQLALQTLDISGNRLTSINWIAGIPSLLVLNASSNSLSDINLSRLTDKPAKLKILDLSKNKLKYLDGNLTSQLPNLTDLRLSANPIADMPFFAQNQNLESIDFSYNSQLETLNLKIFERLGNLKQLSVQNSSNLRILYGSTLKSLSSLEHLLLSNCSLRRLPYDIFRDSPKELSVNVQGNSWPCDCRLNWLVGLNFNKTKFLDSNRTYCSVPANRKAKFLLTDYSLTLNETNCDFGSATKNGKIIRANFGKDWFLDCGFYSRQPLKIRWYKQNDDMSFGELVSTEKQQIYVDGTLKIQNVCKSDVAVYACVAINNATDGNLTLFLRFRIDYAKPWWLLKIYSIACGILVAMAFFALNVISGAVRRLIAWRVTNIERKGRVRLMLQSMEKYRTRQMVHFQEMYTSNVNQIRENYHQQVEALRKSYASQAERFRDYKNVQLEKLETVASHVDFLRDNYNAQMSRIRDYGGKRMERVWLSYQRRVSDLRDYTLQHRGRLMTRYKLKQGYFNKLLESLGSNWSATTRAAPPPELIELRTFGELQCSSTSIDDHCSLPQKQRFSVEMRMIIENSLVNSKKIPRRLSTDLATLEPNIDSDFYQFVEADLKRHHRSFSEPNLTQSVAKNWENQVQSTNSSFGDCNGSLQSCDTYHSVTSMDFVFADKMQK